MKLRDRYAWKAAVVACGAVAVALPAVAHGGGLNAEGCHTNRKTGDYHCHRSASPPPPASRPAYSSSLGESQDAAPSTRSSYSNCTEARAAGAAPVRIGEPGYARHLDRDGDGVGCE